MSSRPTELLIQRGEHKGHTTFNMKVTICSDPNGQLWSVHDFETPEDAALAAKLSGGGLRQVAHALLTEAFRRETFICAMVEMTKDSNFLFSYMEGGEENRRVIEQELAQKARRSMVDVTGKTGVGVAQEILSMLSSQVIPT